MLKILDFPHSKRSAIGWFGSDIRNTNVCRPRVKWLCVHELLSNVLGVSGFRRDAAHRCGSSTLIQVGIFKPQLQCVVFFFGFCFKTIT